MKPRNPDRFERVVIKCSLYGNGSCVPDLVSVVDAIGLLRKEHRWVERMITTEKRELTLLAHKTRQSNDPRDIALADCLYARVHQCEEFIRWLQQRRK